MERNAEPPAHVVRALLLASVTFALAAAAHLLGGGGLPSVEGLVVLTALTVSASFLVTVARTRLWLLVTFLAAAQTLLHHGFAVAATRVPEPVLAHAADHAEHTVLVAGQAAEHAPVTSGAMLVLHVIATVVSSGLFLLGEIAADVAFRVWGAILPALAGVFRPAVPARPRPLRGRSDATPRSVVVTTQDPRRGPPGVPAAA